MRHRERKTFKRCKCSKTRGNGGRCACYLRGVREVSHIPHPIMRVTVHSYNGQYRLQFVVDRFEQAFKFPESDHTLAEVESMAGAMAEDVLLRFVDMRTQYHQSLTP